MMNQGMCHKILHLPYGHLSNSLFTYVLYTFFNGLLLFGIHEIK